MNREARRELKKQGASEETIKKLDLYDQPCSLSEVIRISRASAEDVISEYQRQSAPLQVAVSLQVEIIKELLISAGIVTEDLFKKLYMEKATKFNDMQRAQLHGYENPNMEPKVSDIDVKVEE